MQICANRLQIGGKSVANGLQIGGKSVANQLQIGGNRVQIGCKSVQIGCKSVANGLQIGCKSVANRCKSVANRWQICCKSVEIGCKSLYMLSLVAMYLSLYLVPLYDRPSWPCIGCPGANFHKMNRERCVLTFDSCFRCGFSWRIAWK